jgi:hypothetical protein
MEKPTILESISNTPCCPTIIPGVTPIIFLDIDEVLNCQLVLVNEEESIFSEVSLLPVFESMDVRDQKKFCRLKNHKVKYSPKVIHRINKWSEIAEIRWMTSWEEAAMKLFAPSVGLKTFSVPTFEKYNLQGKSLKIKSSDGSCFGDLKEFEGAQQFFSPEDRKRPLVWIDDDLQYMISNACENVHQIMENKMLLIDPCRRTNSLREKSEWSLWHRGLVEEDLDIVDWFLKETLGSSSSFSHVPSWVELRDTPMTKRTGIRIALVNPPHSPLFSLLSEEKKE